MLPPLPTPELPNSLVLLIDFIDRLVVPLTMVWFSVHWFWLLPAVDQRQVFHAADLEGKAEKKERADKEKKRSEDEKNRIKTGRVETDDEKAERVAAEKWFEPQKRKAHSSTPKGIVLGLTIAVLISFLSCRIYFGFCAKPLQAATSITGCSLAWALGVGVLIGVLTGAVVRFKWSLTTHPLCWRLIVAAGTTIGLTSIVLYYAGSSEFAPHNWLVWGAMGCLTGYLTISPIGD